MNTELQQRIIKQATRMFFCNGIKSVTMDMIASQLGISKRTLYENFKEKNELLLAFFGTFRTKIRKWKKGLG